MPHYDVKSYKKTEVHHYIRDDVTLFCSKNITIHPQYITMLQKNPHNLCKKCHIKAIELSYHPFKSPICTSSEARIDDEVHTWSFNGYSFEDEHGHICNCNGCRVDDENTSEETIKKAIQNKHCLYCECYNCVCELRKESELFDKEVMTQYWDNPCQGCCKSCEVRS